jgi:Flp pilus assembly protein TadB
MVIITIVVCCGLGVAAGAIGLLHSFHPKAPRLTARRNVVGRKLGLPVGLAVATGIGIGVLTQWPAAAILGAGAGFGLPAVVRATGKTNPTARTEAIATWTELLRDTLSAASGLSQALVSTAPLAPDAIKREVHDLASRLTSGIPLSDALRLFADEMNDPSSDLVVCALTLAASARAQRLVELLTALSESIHDEVKMRLRVESSRASARSGVRTIALFSLGFAGVLELFAHTYLQPFGTPIGQLVLLVAGGLNAAGVVSMIYLVRERRPLRLIENIESVERRIEVSA